MLIGACTCSLSTVAMQSLVLRAWMWRVKPLAVIARMGDKCTRHVLDFGIAQEASKVSRR